MSRIIFRSDRSTTRKMSKYDHLDARTELEQSIAKDIKQAFEKRGFSVKHNGTLYSHAHAGKPDIELWDSKAHICVEVTKSVKSNQDREWQSIKDHFEETKKNNSQKECLLWFISPQTHYRTINSIKDWNFTHDQKIIPICFSTLQVFLIKLIQSTRDNYNRQEILSLSDRFTEFVDDENILRHFHHVLFSEDIDLKKTLERREEERHQRVVEELIAAFINLEQKLRDERVALSTDAIKNVIYLVFIKLYEEKKEKEENQQNRFTVSSFKRYQDFMQDTERSIHKLFESIKKSKDIKKSKLLTEGNLLSERLTDNFVLEHFIKPFEQYAFFTTKIDGLGAAYEVLGKLSGKDTKVGQFFTPENVVNFMVKVADLDVNDIVFDPACGTARFLISAMDDKINKAHGIKNEGSKIDEIKMNHLFGTDDDPTVSRLAKMNMYIHGDGKTNVLDTDGLTQYGKDSQVDVILTNPPLGDISYWRSIYDDRFRLQRMHVIPKKNKTEEKLKRTFLQLKEEQLLLHQTTNSAIIKKTQKRILQLQKKQQDLTYRIEHGEADIVAAGKLMKGGALFLNACKYYLKDIRNSSEKPEWRGGKLLIILDEGVLNDEQYSHVREFLKSMFYIKAIFSLTKDTFVPVSNTYTKTSILFAIKKEDTDAVQQEPIFYAHASKVGLNTRKKVCANHLEGESSILAKYREFKEKVLLSYDGVNFRKSKFLAHGFKDGRLP